MRGRIHLVVASWPFLGALAALLVNDWWFKSAFPGFISGKLSDVAGLCVLGLLLFAAWPTHSRKIYLALILAFVWWKSPLSEHFIQLLNAQLPVRIGRTVDYGDLAALLILPVCSYVIESSPRFSITQPRLRKVLFVPVVIATLLGTMGTSVIPTRQHYDVRRTVPADELNREQVNEAIATVAAKHGLRCEGCPNSDGSMVYSGRGITMRYIFLTAHSVSFTIEAWPGALFFGSSGRDKADSLQADLKDALGERFKYLEFVQQL